MYTLNKSIISESLSSLHYRDLLLSLLFTTGRKRWDLWVTTPHLPVYQGITPSSLTTSSSASPR